MSSASSYSARIPVNMLSLAILIVAVIIIVMVLLVLFKTIAYRKQSAHQETCQPVVPEQEKVNNLETIDVVHLAKKQKTEKNIASHNPSDQQENNDQASVHTETPERRVVRLYKQFEEDMNKNLKDEAPFINSYELIGSRIEIKVDVDTVEDCKEFLGERWPKMYDSKIFYISVVPWNWAGKENSSDLAACADLSYYRCTIILPGSTIRIKQSDRFGTIGAFLRDDDYNFYALTCQHVLEQDSKGYASYNQHAIVSEMLAEGDQVEVVELGKQTWGISCHDESYYRENRHSIEAGNDSDNCKHINYDITLLELYKSQLTELCKKACLKCNCWPERLVMPQCQLQKGMKVAKIGARTGHTVGKITYVNRSPRGNFMVKSATSGHFAQKGDSGSLVTILNQNGEREVVGLVVIVEENNSKTICFSFQFMFEEMRRKMRELGRNNLQFAQQHAIDMCSGSVEDLHTTESMVDLLSVDSGIYNSSTTV